MIKINIDRLCAYKYIWKFKYPEKKDVTHPRRNHGQVA